MDLNGFTREAVKQNRYSVKKPIVQKTFLQYFLSELLPLRKFSKANKIIKFRFFIFMTLDTGLPRRFSEQITGPLARSLHKSLLPIKENGWRVLSKLVYNKLIFLCDFIKNLADIDVQILNQSTGSILESFKHIENAFYILSSDHQLIPSLEKELELYVKVVKQKDFPVDSIIRSIQLLLLHNEQRLTLYSFFTALNSIHFRRYCDVGKLIQNDAGPYFFDNDFDLDKSTRTSLSNYVDEVVAAIRKHMDIHQEIPLFEDFIPTKERLGKRDIDALRTFYNGKESADDRYANDQYNVLLFVVTLCRKVNVEFKRLLTEEISLSGQSASRIFDDTLFSNYLGRIDFLKKKLDTIMLKTPVLKKERYLEVVSGGAKAEDDEASINIISELLTNFFQIAKILASILRYAIRSSKSESVPVIRLIAFRDIQFFIPFEDAVQFSSAFLSGKTIRESLNAIAKILLVLCLDMKETELVGIINKDKNTMNSLKQFIKELQRVTTSVTYAELKQELHIDDIEMEMESE